MGFHHQNIKNLTNKSVDFFDNDAIFKVCIGWIKVLPMQIFFAKV